MRAEIYVDEINRAVGDIKDAHALGILTTKELNVEFTAKTHVIQNLALRDSEIGSEDYDVIMRCITRAISSVSQYIFS